MSALIGGLVLVFPFGLVAVPGWMLWTFWRQWPQRRFSFAGQIVSRDRYPVSYWLGLGFGSTFAVIVALQGLRFLIPSVVRLVPN